MALALASLALAAAPARGADADDAVVVIRGSHVSVARPLTPERVRDGSAEVEIVRAPVAAPAARPRPPAPERELVVVVLPAEGPAPPVGIPVAWASTWPWAWHPGFQPPRAPSGPRGHFPPGLHPLGIHRRPVRNGLHWR